MVARWDLYTPQPRNLSEVYQNVQILQEAGREPGPRGAAWWEANNSFKNQLNSWGIVFGMVGAILGGFSTTLVGIGIGAVIGYLLGMLFVLVYRTLFTILGVAMIPVFAIAGMLPLKRILIGGFLGAWAGMIVEHATGLDDLIVAGMVIGILIAVVPFLMPKKSAKAKP